MEPSPDPHELPAAGVLRNVPPAGLKRLADLGNFYEVKTGEVLIREGEPQNRLYILIDGSLTIKKGKLKEPLAEVGPGETIGEINLFDPDVASATVHASTPSVVWYVNRDGLNAFFANADAEVALLIGLLTELSQRIRATNQCLEEARTKVKKKLGFDGWNG